MSADFRDVIETGGSPISPAPSPKINKKVDAKPQTSILEIVEGLNIDGISSNMNPEMKEKVLVPLANLLDKYGVSESLGESTTAQAGLGLMGLLGDVAPVIKGLAEYISGQRNSLRAEDKEFLDRIKESQMDGDFSDLFVSESEEAPQKQQPLVGPRGENLSAINISNAEVDWWEVMGVENPEKKATGLSPQLTEAFFAKDVGTKLPEFNVGGDKPSIVGLESLEDMATQAGIDYDTVNKADSKYKEIKKEETETIELETINGASKSEMPDRDSGDSIFDMPENLLESMDIDMDDFEISLESED